MPSSSPVPASDALPAEWAGFLARRRLLGPPAATGLVCWVLVNAVALSGLYGHWFTHWGPVSWGLLLVAVHQVVMVPALLVRRPGRTLVAAAGAPFVIGVLAMMPFRDDIDPVNLWAPGYWGLPWVMLAMLVLPRLQVLVLACALYGLFIVLDLVAQLAAAAPVTRIGLASTLAMAPPVAILLLFGDGLLGLTRRNSLAMQRRDAAERRRAGEQLRAEAERELARLVHDHVLQALHGLTRLGSGTDPRLVADECRQAVDVLQGHLTRPGGATDLRRLLEADPALAQAGALLVGALPAMPPSAARGMAAAAHEALGNVVRHADATTCRVTLEHADGQWCCTVRDNGIGFDLDGTEQTRLGLRRSIHERMVAVGGRAAVHSRPAAGTIVELVWPAEPQPRPLQPGALTRQARQVLGRAAVPNLVMAPVFTVLLFPLASPVWPVVVACALLLVVGALLVSRLRDRPLGPGDAALAMGTSFVAWAANLWTAPDVIHLPQYLWLCFACAGLAHLVVLQVSWRRGLLALAGWGLGMVLLLVARYGVHVDWGQLHPVVGIGAGEGVVSIAAFHSGHRLAVRTAQQLEAERLEQLETQRLLVQGQVDDSWTRRTTGEALDLLRAVADGRTPLDDPSLPGAAGAVEARLRDELVLGPGHEALVEQLHRVRAAGWSLTSSLSAESDPAELDAAARLLARAGAPGRPGQQLVVSATRGQVSALVMEPTPAQQAAWRHLDGVRADDEFARLTLAAALA